LSDKPLQDFNRFSSEKLRISDASVQYSTSQAEILALDHVTFEVDFGDTVGIAGESGCGKSTLAWTIMRGLPENARLLDGRILLGSVDIYAIQEREMNSKIRWKEIAMIPQSAMNTFDPVFTIQDQLVETIRIHSDVRRRRQSVGQRNCSSS